MKSVGCTKLQFDRQDEFWVCLPNRVTIVNNDETRKCMFLKSQSRRC